MNSSTTEAFWYSNVFITYFTWPGIQKQEHNIILEFLGLILSSTTSHVLTFRANVANCRLVRVCLSVCILTGIVFEETFLVFLLSLCLSFTFQRLKILLTAPLNL